MQPLNIARLGWVVVVGSSQEARPWCLRGGAASVVVVAVCGRCAPLAAAAAARGQAEVESKWCKSFFFLQGGSPSGAARQWGVGLSPGGWPKLSCRAVERPLASPASAAWVGSVLRRTVASLGGRSGVLAMRGEDPNGWLHELHAQVARHRELVARCEGGQRRYTTCRPWDHRSRPLSKPPSESRARLPSTGRPQMGRFCRDALGL